MKLQINSRKCIKFESNLVRDLLSDIRTLLTLKLIIETILGNYIFWHMEIKKLFNSRNWIIIAPLIFNSIIERNSNFIRVKRIPHMMSNILLSI